jgi:exopolysaccharide biosynthesis polyprenyl glycosylphosphotransferase
MSTLRRRVLSAGLRIFDVLALAGAFLAAVWVASAQESGIPVAELLGLRIRVSNFIVFLALLWLWHLLFIAFGLYGSRRLAKRSGEAVDVIKAMLCATLVLACFGWIFNIELVTASFLTTFWASGVAVLITGRLTMRLILTCLRLWGRNLRHVILVGTNERALAFARRLDLEPTLGYRIAGFVDSAWVEAKQGHDARWTLLGGFTDFPSILGDRVVDEVVLCLPVKSFYEEASRIAALCHEQGVLVRMLPDLFDVSSRRDSGKVLHDHQDLAISLNGVPITGSAQVVKRILDIMIAGTLLVVTAPLFLVIAALIAVDSPGAVFFLQTRRGLNKRPFRMIKFRSMRADAEQWLAELAHLSNAGGPSFKLQRDPRITRVGAFLRRTSLDELPQLINVLRGEMSLVGPRPLFALEFDRIEEEWIKRRCTVKPGLTGLWQVSGRSQVPFETRIRLDLEYIDNWSLGLDLRILVRTIPAVLLGRGAV